jgi:hypothetical protein
LAEDVAVRAVFNVGFPAGESSEEGFPIDDRLVSICRSSLRLVFRQGHNNLLLLAESKHAVSKVIGFWRRF